MDGWMMDGCSLTCHCALLWTLFCTKLGRAWKDRKRESGCSLLLLLVVRFNFPQRRCFSRNLIWVKNGNPAVRLTEPNQNMVFFQRKNMRRPSSSAHQWLLSGGWAPRRVVITTFLHACTCVCFVLLMCVCVCLCVTVEVICSSAPPLFSLWRGNEYRKRMKVLRLQWLRWEGVEIIWLVLSLSVSLSLYLALSRPSFALCHQAGWDEHGVKYPPFLNLLCKQKWLIVHIFACSG